MNTSYVLVSNNPTIYEFDGDLEKELLETGVSIEHINKMKEKIMQDTTILYYQCDDTSSSPKIMNVPVDKIIGVRRACPNISVFENMRRFNRETAFSNSRMSDCLEYANKMSYDELKKSYADIPDAVQLAHIVETDEYYLYGEHNHTTMCALIFDAPFIKAAVTDYHLNTAKVNNYNSMMKFYNEYNIVKIEKEILGNCIRIIFKESDQLYCINYGRIDENDTYYNIVMQLKDILNADMKQIKIYKMLHFKSFQKFWYNFSLTDRQKCFIDKPKYIKDSSKYCEYFLFTKI